MAQREKFRLTPEASRQIELLRFVLICLIVCVHIPGAAEEPVFSENAGFGDYFVTLLREGFGRIGSPILSVISGYLLGAGAMAYGSLLKRRARSLLVPFLVFNLPVFAFVLALQQNGAGTFWPPIGGHGIMGYLNGLFALTARPVNEPLYFLRDLMVCIALSPLVIAGLQRAPRLMALALFAFYVTPAGGWLLVNSLLLPMNALGIALALYRVPIDRFGKGEWYSVPVFVLAAVALAALRLHPALQTDDTLLRVLAKSARLACMLAAMVVLWGIAGWLCARPVGQFLSGLGQNAFFIFLTHQPVGVVLYMAWMRHPVGGYLAFYMGCLAIAVGLAIAGDRIGRRLAPRSFALATGRSGSRRKPSEPRSEEGVFASASGKGGA